MQHPFITEGRLSPVNPTKNAKLASKETYLGSKAWSKSPQK
jgi:hypothetical protein